jgi:hypothetical protein
MPTFESWISRLNRGSLNNINKHKEFNSVITIPGNSGWKKITKNFIIKELFDQIKTERKPARDRYQKKKNRLHFHIQATIYTPSRIYSKVRKLKYNLKLTI